MLCGPHCKNGQSSIRDNDYKGQVVWTYMSRNQHVVATNVATTGTDPDYFGAAWTEPSPIGADISPDADGVFPSGGYQFSVDISHMLSRMLGKQMSMTETYRVTGIKIGVKNVDDIDDNDRGIMLGGFVEWFSPTKHRIDAVQACRRIEKASEAGAIDSDSLFISTVNRYTGFRYNWRYDNEVEFPSGAGAVAGWVAATGEQQWNLRDMLALYGQSIDLAANKDRQMFWTKCGGKSSMRFALALNNAMHQDGALTTVQLIENPAVHDFVWQAEAGRHIDVMGGLLNFNVQQSNTLPNGDASPDDYDVQVEITIEGWSSW